MRHLFLFVCMMFCGAANAAQIVNIEYIHKYITRKWNVEIPYNPALTDPHLAANMKYLLTAVDGANEKLNGLRLTKYGENEQFAIPNAADTVAVIDAVDNLITKIEYPFQFRPTTTDT